MKFKVEVSRVSRVEKYIVQRIHQTDDGAAVGTTFHVAEIIFEDGQFASCSFSALNPYTREQWSMLAALEKLISKIEREQLARPVFP